MTRDEVARQTECVARLAKQLSDNERLHAELQRARRQFFGEQMDGAGDDAAEHRFAEWFLFERESETLGAIPITVPPYSQQATDVEDSIAGLFLVESVGDSVNARDMQNNEMLELADADALQPGDLLVGRLYPVAQERWSASAGAPALRPGRELAEAFVHDLKELDLDRRLQQIELEHLLLRQHGKTEVPVVPGPPPEQVAPLEHLEADLEQLLQSVGDRHSAEIISQQLAVAPRPGALIGPLLDQLAFDTDVDLDKARRLMLEIWNAHHTGKPQEVQEAGSESTGPPGETLGERLVRTLDEGLGEQQDVEKLFQQMEKLAGIESEEDDDDDDDERSTAIVEQLSAPDGDSGDLGPLVTEYHWETEAQDAENSPLTLWVELQRNAPVPNTDLESIRTPDLMRLLLHVYLRSAPGERAAQVRGAFAELKAFYEWVAKTQELDQREVLDACQGALLEQLDRLQDAGVALSNDRAPEQAPGLLQIEELGKDGFGARDDDGGSHWLMADPAALAHLEVGDLLLAGLAAPTGDAPTSMHRHPAGMVVVLPIDARSLIE